MRTPSPQPGHVGRQGSYPLSPTLKALYPHDDPNHRSQSRNGHRASTQAQPYIPRDSAINRTDLIASAERIYSRYLMPGADKEIYLPPHLRIHQFPLSAATLPAVTHPDYDKEADAQAAVPDMFHAQKEQMYRNMETDSFPRFLRAKAFGNLTPMSAMVRLAIGLVCLWVALSTAFSFIFLNVHKTKRLWVSSRHVSSPSVRHELTGILFCCAGDPPVHVCDPEPARVAVRPRPHPGDDGLE